MPPSISSLCRRSEPHAPRDRLRGKFPRSFLSQREGVRKLICPAKIGGRMRFRVKMFALVMAIAVLLGLAGVPAEAQDKQHVVSLSELNKDAARPAQTRQANEEAVRTLLSSATPQKALKSTNLAYQKVDKSCTQLTTHRRAT